MKKNYIVYCMLIFVFFLIAGCGKSNYQEGYDEGHKKGSIEGYKKGLEYGLIEGYNQGYADSSLGKPKKVPIVDSTIAKVKEKYLKVFGVACFFINSLALIVFIIFLVLKEGKQPYILGAKALFLIMSILIAYMIISKLNFSSLTYPGLSEFSKSILIIGIAPITLMVSLITKKVVIGSGNSFLEILSLIVSTFVLGIFIFILTNLEVFLIYSAFASYCMISMSIGGLTFLGAILIKKEI